MTWTAKRHLPDPPTTPARVLDTTFAPSTSRFVLCSYTVQIVAAAGLASTVELRSDSAAPPTTARCSATLSVTGAGDSDTVRQTLEYICPPGDNVRLVTSGTATVTLVNQTETAIA